MIADSFHVSNLFIGENMLKQKVIDFICHSFSEMKMIHGNHVSSIPEEIKKELEDELAMVPEYESVRNLVYCVAKGLELPKCRNCGKTLTYTQFIHKREYCSSYCRDHSSEVHSKRIETVRSRYENGRIGGVKPMSDEERARRKQERKNKSDVCKYGQTGLSPNEKRRMTMEKEYGVKSSFCLPETREKIHEALVSKYGDNPYDEMRKIGQERQKELYGCLNNLSNKEIRDKSLKTYARNTFRKLKQRWAGEVEPLFDEDEYENFHKTYRWKCCHCGNEFESEIYVTDFSDLDRYLPRCLVCHPYCNGFSHKEKEVVDFVKSIYSGKVIENDHSVIAPYELDILIPEKHVAIEFNGDYWHSEASGKGEKYHSNKTEMCAEHGIKLVHVFEHDWDKKQEIVKDMLGSIIGVGQRRIFARKCVVKNIKSNVSNEFLEANHLQGGDKSSVRYGLYHGDELVSVMTFGKPRFNKNHDWELIRFASKIGTQVIGGASKLLSAFRKENKGSVVSYADRSHSDGNVYEKMGFNLVGVSKPNYVWLNKEGVMLTRYQCQKHRLASVLGDGFNENESETENMKRNGWIKVFDCGNLVYWHY